MRLYFPLICILTSVSLTEHSTSAGTSGAPGRCHGAGLGGRLLKSPGPRGAQGMAHDGLAEQQSPAQPETQASWCTSGLESAQAASKNWAAPQGKQIWEMKVKAGQAKAVLSCSRVPKQGKQSRSSDLAYAYFRGLKGHECKNVMEFRFYHPTQL